ncbi:MAG TPA: pyruvate dehydrogenase (acetyl-transferring) E1 component subunit alpha [Fibrobacteria bacterium]|nr:pyruvate dehydrogenase (acetyl-transferring) E1 component subunit alpha [Fibrobacteria bacterium]
MASAKKEAPVLAKEKQVELLEKMLIIRFFEEASIKAYQQKKIAGFLHPYIGQEAVGVGTLDHKLPQDTVVTTYRCHGLSLALGMPPKDGMAELFGKVTGCARGKGGSMHFFSKPHNFLGGHGIVGGQFGIGIGAAFKSNYDEDNAVSFIFFGDGATPQGTFHECMNLAALWDLPAIFICEDNQYGMGTACARAIANTDIASKAEAYGVKGYTLNGMDLHEVNSRMKDIVHETRTKRRPALVHVKTYRYTGHSVSDAGLYRTKEEVEANKLRDPILAVSRDLVESKAMTEEELKALQKKTKALIQEAVDFADESPEPPVEELTQHVYFDQNERD